jgi:hypothetical protein
MREEPSFKTLWLKNMGTMDKVQIIDRSNTAPSSKTTCSKSLEMDNFEDDSLLGYCTM